MTPPNMRLERPRHERACFVSCVGEQLKRRVRRTKTRSPVPFNEPYNAIVRVLLKIGANPGERLDSFDQDPEYTACRVEELPAYFDLYVHGVTDPSERAVLCCFLMQGLNDLCAQGIIHPLQPAIFDALLDAGEIHASELAYWTDTSDPDSEN